MAPGGRQLNGSAVTNRTLLILLGPVAGLAMFAGSVSMASSLASRMALQPAPAPAPAPQGSPARGNSNR